MRTDLPLVHPEYEFRCPFCAGTVALDVASQGLLHTDPPCPRFIAEEPADFIRSCHKAKTN